MKGEFAQPSKKSQNIMNMIVAMLSLFYMSSNYSINTLPSHHSTYNFFHLPLQPCFFIQKNFSFNFEHDGLCLKVLHQCINIYFDPLCRDDTIIWAKNNTRETGFLIYKSEISVAKNITPSRDRIILSCN